MNCQRVRVTMYLVSDNEAEPDVLTRFQRHLEACPECARQFDYLTRLLALVRERCCRQAAPVELRQRIVATLRHTRTIEIE